MHWWPGVHWLRIGFSLTGDLKAKRWGRGQDMYHGLIRRYAWPVLGCGPYVIWLRKGPTKGDGS